MPCEHEPGAAFQDQRFESYFDIWFNFRFVSIPGNSQTATVNLSQPGSASYSPGIFAQRENFISARLQYYNWANDGAFENHGKNAEFQQRGR